MADPYRPWQSARVLNNMTGGGGPHAAVIQPQAAPARPSQMRLSQQDMVELQREVREQADFMKKLKEEPRLPGVVVEIREDAMLVCIGAGQMVDVQLHEDAKVGDRVLCKRDTNQVLEIIHDKNQTGMVIAVERVTKGLVEATTLGMVKTYRIPNDSEGTPMPVKVGERVILDPSMTYVIGTLGMPPAQHAVTPKTGITWDDVGGQLEAKAALREAIELPMAHPKLFAAYGKKPIKGVLLEGGPGLGKTLIAKAAATAIARAHGQDSLEGFQYIKGPELLDPFIGKTEANIRAMFAATRVHRARFGYAATVFIDECDALLGRRDRSLHTSIGATVVPAFLAEMDGLDDFSAFFILATNRADTLDAAVVRDGRIDRKVRVTRPTRDDAREIFQIHLRGRPLAGAGDAAKQRAKKRTLADRAPTDLIDRAINAIYSDNRVVRDLDGNLKLRLRDFISGAIIANIVERATTQAMHRDIEAGTDEPTGIGDADLLFGIDRAEEKVRRDDHTEVIRELAEAAEHLALKTANKEQPSAP